MSNSLAIYEDTFFCSLQCPTFFELLSKFDFLNPEVLGEPEVQSDDEWLAVNTILDETTVRDIIPRLKQAGGEGIVEYPLNKIVL